MHPLERELRRRRRLAGRLSALAIALVVGTAGAVAPGLGEQRELRARLAAASARLAELRSVEADVRRFEREGLPLLERALERMRRSAPPEDLPAGTRAALKERFERAGAVVEDVRVGDRGPCPGLVGEEDSEEGAALWEATAVTVTGRCPWDRLPALLEAATGGKRWVLLREVRCERLEEPLGSLRFVLELACLHFTEPEPFASEEDWDEEAFAIEEDEP